MSFAEGMTARDQSNGFFVVHRHATKSFANIFRCLEWIGNTLRAFGIHVDETHSGRAEGICEIALARIAFVGSHPGCFKSPVDVEVWLPNIGTSAGEAKRLEAHRFHGDIAREDHQVRPRDLLAVFLFDRP